MTGLGLGLGLKTGVADALGVADADGVELNVGVADALARGADVAERGSMTTSPPPLMKP